MSHVHRRLVLLLLTCIACYYAGWGQANIEGFTFQDRPDQKQINLFYDGKLITSYCYYDTIRKPFLFPINTLDGITVTRGYPVKPLPGESTDHPHHTGSWLNYESVNGLDFWNNSTAIPLEKRNLYGTIVHTGVIKEQAAGPQATLETTANWLQPDGYCLLKENTTYHFTVRNDMLILDRTTVLTAQDKKVVFADSKDGLFAIRVAKELEQPAKGNQVFTDIHGNKTVVASKPTSATGKYYSSEGLTGDSVWGTRARWVMLKGKKENRDITIAIIDHPENPGYPAYWHARGYGLFAVNPLGQKIFSNGKEELNLTLQPHASTTFRYRVLIASHDLNKGAVERETRDFSRSMK
jgi:Methane oxygenase PmoA